VSWEIAGVKTKPANRKITAELMSMAANSAPFARYIGQTPLMHSSVACRTHHNQARRNGRVGERPSPGNKGSAWIQVY
jgi:hypothetical protein